MRERPHPRGNGEATAPALEEVVVIDARVWRRVVNGLLATVVAVLAVSALFVSQRALATLDDVLVPQFDRDAETIARTVGTEIERAHGLGIPFEKMRGMAPFFDGYLARHTPIAYLAATGPDGAVVHAAGRKVEELEAAVAAGRLAPVDAPARIIDLSSVRNASFPLASDEDGGERFARLQVGMDRAYAERQIADIRWDVLVVLIVSLLITFELLVFVVDRSVMTPLRLIERTVREASAGNFTVRPRAAIGRDEIGRVLLALDGLGRRIEQSYRRIDSAAARISALPHALAERLEALRRHVRVEFDDARAVPARVDARLPLFVFVFAEELSRAFLPLYAERLFVPPGAIVPALAGIEVTPAVIVALPIVVFMGFVALATPFGGTLVARYGPRRIFLLGAIPAAAGYLGTAAAVTVYDLLVWRSLSAVGYAVVTIAAQGYIAASAEPGQRARAMATFVAAVTTAVICGSSIGAVLADRVGYRATFLVSGVLVAIAILVASRVLQAGAGEAPRTAVRLRNVAGALRNGRFAALVLFAAIPAKIALTGFLFYLTPLYLDGLGVGEPAIGRTIMLYGVFMLAGTQLGAFIGDRGGAYALLVATGGALTGAALAGGTLLDPVSGTAAAIAVFGLAQGLASAPMLALLPLLCPNEAARYGATSLVGLLRLSERVGSVVGPLLAAALIARAGYGTAILAIAAVSAAGAALFLAIAARPGAGRQEHDAR